MHPQDKKILRLLISNEGRNLTTEEIIDYLYIDDESGGPLWAKSVVAVVICRIRKRLLPEYEIILGYTFYSLRHN